MLDEQYDLIAGSWADNYNEVMLVVDENNEIDDYTLYSLGFKDPAEVKKILRMLLLEIHMRQKKHSIHMMKSSTRSLNLFFLQSCTDIMIHLEYGKMHHMMMNI